MYFNVQIVHDSDNLPIFRSDILSQRNALVFLCPTYSRQGKYLWFKAINNLFVYV